ncbi:MAG: MarR family transcriptional regulator [Dysgonamonadaceae bacterium]|jgi:DNA-binding MarR family transcriptional regulator|nr:MarR family transcriptional regulator [Dysgonamonadaceae bacterium]
MDEKLKDMDVLLVREKGSNELKIADKDGKAKSVKPEDGENPDLFKINMRGNLIENFFENFKRQVKDPTRFEFFRVPAEKFQEVVNKLQKAFQNPDKPANKKFLDMHRVEPEDLFWMLLHDREVTQIALSVHSKIDAATTSSVLRTLQKKGLIQRQEHSTDTRAKRIYITEQGKALIKKAVVTVEQTDREFFTLLGEKINTFNGGKSHRKKPVTGKRLPVFLYRAYF